MKPVPVEKHCEGCGERFQCGQYPCWCREISITDRQYDWITARYSDCLCPECLRKVCLSDGDMPGGVESPSCGGASGLTDE
jgi:hypothetical protein